ncbi:MAG: hypothetical protein Q8O13_11180 [Candidatus Omnitrophota bacterium]|nr:hypothetical protein [Candidatus Omnitrophota bacterium]
MTKKIPEKNTLPLEERGSFYFEQILMALKKFCIESHNQFIKPHHSQDSKNVSFNADIRGSTSSPSLEPSRAKSRDKSNADKRRFIIANICDHLRYICGNLRSKLVFQKSSSQAAVEYLIILCAVLTLFLLSNAVLYPRIKQTATNLFIKSTKAIVGSEESAPPEPEPQGCARISWYVSRFRDGMNRFVDRGTSTNLTQLQFMNLQNCAVEDCSARYQVCWQRICALTGVCRDLDPNGHYINTHGLYTLSWQGCGRSVSCRFRLN